MDIKYYSEGGYPIFHGTEHSAGIDLPYYDPIREIVVINPFQRVKLPTGIHMEIPEGYYGEIDSRSSTSKLLLLPLCRTIDSDYRGNIHVVVVNLGEKPVVISRGQYLFQMIIKPYLKISPNKVESQEDLSKTLRGVNGFGHTTEKRGNENEGI